MILVDCVLWFYFGVFQVLGLHAFSPWKLDPPTLHVLDILLPPDFTETHRSGDMG